MLNAFFHRKPITTQTRRAFQHCSTGEQNTFSDRQLIRLFCRIDASSGEAAMRGLHEERMRKVYSSITYHSKNVGWNDEFKVCS